MIGFFTLFVPRFLNNATNRLLQFTFFKCCICHCVHGFCLSCSHTRQFTVSISLSLSCAVVLAYVQKCRFIVIYLSIAYKSCARQNCVLSYHFCTVFANTTMLVLFFLSECACTCDMLVSTVSSACILFTAHRNFTVVNWLTVNQTSTHLFVVFFFYTRRSIVVFDLYMRFTIRTI